MIPILYDENEINLADDVRFKSNGLGLLKDTIYCYSEEERNENYELELAYPVGSFLFEEIKGNRFIRAKANDELEEQIFRIYYISQPINGEITVKAEHISYLLKDNFIEKVQCNGNCQTALNTLNSNTAFPTRFNFNSNISMKTTFKHERENLWDCIKGIDGSIIDTYGNGADIVRDNFNISILQNAGNDNNILIAYKKNMTGFTCEEDWTGCKTRIYPFAIRDDVVYTIPEKYVSSEYINRDPTARIEKIDFSQEFEDDEEITEEKLKILAHNYFILNGIDIPKLSYKVEFVTLSKTEEFKNIIKNEKLGLFDTVIIRHEVYNIDTKIRILKVKYDSLLEKYETIELNYTKPRISKNLIKSIKKTQKKIQDTKEELKGDIEDAKLESAEATNNLKVVMEKRDSEIELSVSNEAEQRKTAINVLDGKIDLSIKNEATARESAIEILEDSIEERVTNEDFQAYRKTTAEEISDKVSKGNDFSTEMKQNWEAFRFLFNNGTDGETTIDRDGITVKCGGFKVVNSSGKTVMEFNSDGQCIAKYMSATDLNCVNTGKNSTFYHMLYNMDETSFKRLNATKLYISGQHIYDYIVDVLNDKGLLD